MKKDFTKEAWDSFAEAVIPPDAPERQYTEMRRAFYAGAWATLQCVVGIGSDDNISEDQGCQILDGLEAELKKFQRDVVEGRA